MSGPSPLTSTHAGVPEFVRLAIETEVARVCKARFDGSLRAAVLTGSLARSEASGKYSDGVWMLSSDADVFLVVRDGATWPSERSIELAAKEIETALARTNIHVKIGLAGITEQYLRNLPRHIATYELKACGKVIFGDPETLSLVPGFGVTELSHEDAWRLLANRIIEALEALASSNGDLTTAAVYYSTIKLHLDIGTSYLVFAGGYAPTYRGREQALVCGAREPNPAVDLGLLRDNLSACTSAKLDGAGISKPFAQLWCEGVHLAEQLWNWELRQLVTGASEGDPMREFMRQQPLREKLHGWASAARRCYRTLGVIALFRWLPRVRRASPRYLIYSAACSLFFQMSKQLASDENSWSGPAGLDLLPLAARTGDEFTNWRRAALLICRNYRELLETTAA